eukprot:GFYU01015593.1.p1 GENE.GFYU01015593.1~~GFYU01015593.1.p1  ORF type:complete len:153 (+),score=34.51 GFYU01015593.1:2-460(+)
MIMLSLHPDAPAPHKVFGESCCHIGTAMGCIWGSHLHHVYYGTHILLLPSVWHETWYISAAVRMLLGMTFLVVVLEGTKELYKICTVQLCKMAGMPFVPYGAIEKGEYNKADHTNFTLRIDAYVRFFAYSSMTAAATFAFPTMCYWYYTHTQ